LVFPIKYRDLPSRAQLVFTVWEVRPANPALKIKAEPVAIGGSTFPLFNKKGVVKLGHRKLFLWKNKPGGCCRSMHIDVAVWGYDISACNVNRVHAAVGACVLSRQVMHMTPPPHPTRLGRRMAWRNWTRQVIDVFAVCAAVTRREVLCDCPDLPMQASLASQSLTAMMIRLINTCRVGDVYCCR